MGRINDTLMCLSIKYNGDFDDILDAVKSHEDIDYDAMVGYKKELRYKYTKMIKDDTMVYSINSHKHRFIISVKPVTFKNESVLDYCVACENQNDLDDILSYLKRNESGLKDYGQVKKRNDIER